MATYDDYYKANLANGQKRLDEENAAAKRRDEELMRQIGAAIDQSAGEQENTYQQSIDEAPSRFQSAYDANTIGELIGRRQLQESMANLGLTDSGLSRTQGTALTVARQNADASTRADQTEYVNKLKSAIDAVRANAAAQKAEKQIALDTERDSWYRQAIAQMQSDAQSAAAKAWEADQTYAAEKYKADAEAAAAVEKARYEALTAQAKASSTASTNYDKNRLAYAQTLMKQGAAEEDAWAAAVARYPYDNSSAENKKTNSYNSAYTNAKNSGYSSEYARVYAEAAANGEDGKDAVDAYMCQKAINAVKKESIGRTWSGAVGSNVKELKKQATAVLTKGEYAGLSDEEKELAVAYLVGSALKNSAASEPTWIDKLMGSVTKTDVKGQDKVRSIINGSYSGLAQQVALTAAGIKKQSTGDRVRRTGRQ